MKRGAVAESQSDLAYSIDGVIETVVKVDKSVFLPQDSSRSCSRVTTSPGCDNQQNQDLGRLPLELHPQPVLLQLRASKLQFVGPEANALCGLVSFWHPKCRFAAELTTKPSKTPSADLDVLEYKPFSFNSMDVDIRWIFLEVSGLTGTLDGFSLWAKAGCLARSAEARFLGRGGAMPKITILSLLSGARSGV